MAAEVVEIADRDSGSTARILVSQGFNCFSWRPVLDDGPREMLWAEPGFEQGDKRPSGSGIPLLFPFPGRIGGARFRFDGKDYSLRAGRCVRQCDSRLRLQLGRGAVVEQSGARVVGEFQASVDDPSILDTLAGRFSHSRFVRSARPRAGERHSLREHGRRAAAVRIRHACLFSLAAY